MHVNETRCLDEANVQTSVKLFPISFTQNALPDGNGEGERCPGVFVDILRTFADHCSTCNAAVGVIVIRRLIGRCVARRIAHLFQTVSILSTLQSSITSTGSRHKGRKLFLGLLFGISSHIRLLVLHLLQVGRQNKKAELSAPISTSPTGHIF